METARRRAALVLITEKHGTDRDTGKPEYDLYRIFNDSVKSSQVVGLRDRVAIIRTLYLIFSSRPLILTYAGSGEVWLR